MHQFLKTPFALPRPTNMISVIDDAVSQYRTYVKDLLNQDAKAYEHLLISPTNPITYTACMWISSGDWEKLRLHTSAIMTQALLMKTNYANVDDLQTPRIIRQSDEPVPSGSIFDVLMWNRPEKIFYCMRYFAE